MAQITIQVLEGFERGRVYADLVTPVTIGREEDNSIQLNDERVSRFHVKIQEDGGRFILTDLDSTNGTKINGHPVQMRVLQPGDQVAIGRSVLLFGSDDEIQQNLESSISDIARKQADSGGGSGVHRTVADIGFVDDEGDADLISSGGFESSGATEERAVLFPGGPPDLPAGLRIAQSAQLSDLLAYVHDQLAAVVESAQEDRRGMEQDMRVDRANWQRLLRLEMQLARYMRHIIDP